VLLLRVTGNVVPTSPIYVTLMMEEVRFTVTSVLTRAAVHKMAEDSDLHIGGSSVGVGTGY
jgi:phospholipid N-methyltransferase